MKLMNISTSNIIPFIADSNRSNSKNIRTASSSGPSGICTDGTHYIIIHMKSGLHSNNTADCNSYGLKPFNLGVDPIIIHA